MELKTNQTMDVSDQFQPPETHQEINKTDFFDFVVTPDAAGAEFTKQMRSVNVFLSDGSDELREPNNNNMIVSEISSSGAEGVSGFDANLWNEKDTIKIETAILEDLNKYCWTNDEVNGVVQIKQESSVNNNNNNNSNGQIYTTLTVLNGLEQASTWYRPSLAIKEEDVSISSPTEMEHLHSGIDIDSFLSIIPNQISEFNSPYDNTTMSPNTDGLIKSETYTYEDSGFADNKEELGSTLIIDTPLLEAHDSFNNNNNDWKLQNQNTTTSTSAADSLLRSALQGKPFVRYNGAKSTGKVVEQSNVELRRCLSESPTKTDTIFIKEDTEHNIPTIVAGIDANGKVVFEEHLPTPRPPAVESVSTIETASSSQQHMDDLILSHLDHPYSEDYEKLTRIANEVAESVSQYCIETTSSDSTSNVVSADQIGILYNITSPIQITTAPSVVSSTKNTKKYKRQNSGAKAQTSLASATSTTTNAVRKERSLHYCSICTKGFKDKYSVNVHIRTHTGEKPFACSLCGKTFRQKAHLAKHYQTHIAQKNAAQSGAVPSGKSKTR
ncbi:zinc finger protein 287-like isoform X2 [Anthonomus grandis grandis]|nr:zinc finger protein 287-like isoform X2 [Anthonomus grandis grandis]